MRSSILPVCCLIILTITAAAETYTVSPEAHVGDFPNIQAAVDAVVDGDIIELTDGVFRGEGNRDVDYLGKAITVRSQRGNAEVCIIDCEGSVSQRHRGFLFRNNEGPDAVLGHVTVTGGYPPGGTTVGGAVLCLGSVSPTLHGCRFVGNQATWGGGVYCDQASPALDGCAFNENTASMGGGMYCFGGAPVLRGCSFLHNATALGGGGFKGDDSGFAVFERCTFAWNSAGVGGGVYT